MNFRTKFFTGVAILLFSVLFSNTFAQLTLPKVSPHQTVSHTIGLSTIMVDYHSPGVKDRKVFGGIVAYGLNAGVPFGSGNSFPWRAGANENTVITFSDDVKVNGKSLRAGSYGFHLIPGEKEFVAIFSTNNTSWGSFFYDESEDALRVTLKPEKAPKQEWLAYGFDKFTPNSAELYLVWEELKLPLTIEVNTTEIVLKSLRNELRSTNGFGWQGLNQAAAWCATNNVNQEEALTWVENSIQRNSNFTNLATKAQLLGQLGRQKEADEIMKSAVEVANEGQLNTYGYQLLGAGRVDDAVKIFELNIKRNPESWNAYDSLAEGLQTKGETKAAKKNYEKALKMAPENQKARIQGVLNAL
ncbi:MAG: DUF2911 domain-containing protein [Bacteroidetes bacterium]|nr:DUF2911 domain-containing protein [Bacteroidota bacterium]